MNGMRVAAVTVNGTGALDSPFTTTMTSPLVAPVGSATTIKVSLHDMIVVTNIPLKVTVLVPCVFPKPRPTRLTNDPTDPADGDTELTTSVKSVVLQLVKWARESPEVDVANNMTPASETLYFTPEIVTADCPAKIVPVTVPDKNPEPTKTVNRMCVSTKTGLKTS